MRVLFFYLIASLLTDVICFFLARQGLSNYIIRNLFTLVEFGCLSFIYINKFDSPRIKALIISFSVLFFFAATILYLINKKFNQQEDVLSAIVAFFFMLISYIYAYLLFRDYKLNQLQDDVFFWVNNAILIYFSSNFVLFLFFGYVVKFKLQLFYFVYSFQLFTSIIYYLTITLGLWKAKVN